MAVKYFVINDIMFQTIDVREDNFQGRSAANTIETTYLENIISAISEQSATALVPGTTDAEQLIALTGPQGWWSETATGIDVRQQTARQIVNQKAPLRLSQVTDSAGNEMGTVHQLSYQYIFPTDLWEGVYATITNVDNTNRTRALNKDIIKSFCVRHDDIVKHPSQGEARAAYNSHTLKQLIDDNESTIDSNYLKSASMTSGD